MLQMNKHNGHVLRRSMGMSTYLTAPYVVKISLTCSLVTLRVNRETTSLVDSGAGDGERDDDRDRDRRPRDRDREGELELCLYWRGEKKKKEGIGIRWALPGRASTPASTSTSAAAAAAAASPSANAACAWRRALFLALYGRICDGDRSNVHRHDVRVHLEKKIK